MPQHALPLPGGDHAQEKSSTQPGTPGAGRLRNARLRTSSEIFPSCWNSLFMLRHIPASSNRLAWSEPISASLFPGSRLQLLPQLLRQILFQCFSSPQDPRLYGAQRDLQYLRDLLVAQAIHFAQHQCRSKCRRNLLQSRFHQGLCLPIQRQLKGRRPRILQPILISLRLARFRLQADFLTR